MSDVSVQLIDQPYYEALGLSHDNILRCHDCKALVTYARLMKLGCCECGCRRVEEVRTLAPEEMEQIHSGAIDFPHRDKFLAEFADEDTVAALREADRRERFAKTKPTEFTADELAEPDPDDREAADGR